jgi:hypothetical protein
MTNADIVNYEGKQIMTNGNWKDRHSRFFTKLASNFAPQSALSNMLLQCRFSEIPRDVLWSADADPLAVLTFAAHIFAFCSTSEIVYALVSAYNEGAKQFSQRMN